MTRITILRRIARNLIAVSLPVLLLTLNIHLVTAGWFLRFEYHRPGFPEDTYGFSTTERLQLADTCITYLQTGADISLLADLTLADGQPAFDQRELSHMADVQAVYGYLPPARIASLVILTVGIALLVGLKTAARDIPRALIRSGIGTCVLLVAAGLFMALAWDTFFETFHALFFTGDSWLFRHSDTLIRLFPIRFWVDAASLIVILQAVEALLGAAAVWLYVRRK